MTDFKLSPHFSASEIFSRQMLIDFGQNVTWFIDPRLLTYLEFMRSRFGVVHVNDWKYGGRWDSRGFRSPSDNEGGTMSQHRYGRAADITFRSVHVEDVRNDIKENWRELYTPLGITTIEDRVNWIHADMRYIPGQTEIFIVQP